MDSDAPLANPVGPGAVLHAHGTAANTARIAAIPEGHTDAILVLDNNWRCVYLNERAAAYLGRSISHLIGRNLWETCPDLVGSVFEEMYRLAVRTGEAATLVAHEPPFESWVEVRAFPAPAGLAVQFRDMTERKAELIRLRYLATHDTLTGLPNRAHFLECLGRSLARSARDQTTCAVLFLDLDSFKEINDCLGHCAGDQLLAAVAGRLRGALSEGDTLARLGGDEFSILLERVADEAEVEAAGRRLLAVFDAPFALRAHTCRIGASIGGVLGPLAAQRPEDALEVADMALYAAKRAGRARFVLSAPTHSRDGCSAARAVPAEGCAPEARR